MDNPGEVWSEVVNVDLFDSVGCLPPDSLRLVVEDGVEVPGDREVGNPAFGRDVLNVILAENCLFVVEPVSREEDRLKVGEPLAPEFDCAIELDVEDVEGAGAEVTGGLALCKLTSRVLAICVIAVMHPCNWF